MKRTCQLSSAAAFILVFSIEAVFGQQAPVPNDGTLPPAAPNAAVPEAEPAASPTNKTEPAAPPATKSKSPAADELSVEQARLADRFKRLEEVVGRLAELSAGSDPRREKLLREAIAQSREQDVNTRFESIVKLLQDERLSAASTNQTELQKELDSLLNLLLKADRDKELASQRDRVKQYIKQLEGIIRMQKGVRARTEGGDELKGLGKDQRHINTETGKLGGDISKSDGDKKSGGDDSSKPGDKSPQKSDDKEKPKSDDKQSSKPADKQSAKPDGKDKPKPVDKPKPDSEKPDNPSKPKDKAPNPGDTPKSDDKSKPGDKPSEDGKPSSSKSPPKDSKPSDEKPSKPSDSPPSDSPPSEGKPGSPSENEADKPPQPPQPQEPADRAVNRLREAQERMDDALKKIEESARKGATEQQLQAIKQLEQAKAELERILRQLREEELERTLTQLAARFRKMLELQTAVYDGTIKLDQVPEARRTHDHEIESARLSRQESQIVHEVDKALLLLHEDGSSVAFPEAIEQMRDDMRQVTDRLANLKVEKVTQGLEKDIIAALEEAVAAFEQSRKDLEKKKTPPGQQAAAGQPDDQSLVEKIAELKMIRSLQMRINNRTKIYGEMIQGDQADTPELLKSLDGLADRQQRVFKAASDLEQGRNK